MAQTLARAGITAVIPASANVCAKLCSHSSAVQTASPLPRTHPQASVAPHLSGSCGRWCDHRVAASSSSIASSRDHHFSEDGDGS